MPKKKTATETVFEMNSDIAQQFGRAAERAITTHHQMVFVAMGAVRQLGVLAYAVANVADALRARKVR